MVTSEERRKIARRLRELSKDTEEVSDFDLAKTLGLEAVSRCGYAPEDVLRLADIIDPDISSFYDADWRRWYEGLSHTDGDDSPRNLREVLEDIVWAVLTIDLGPNSNVDCGIDDGIVQTESLLDAWEREIREIIESEPERTPNDDERRRVSGELERLVVHENGTTSINHGVLWSIAAIVMPDIDERPRETVLTDLIERLAELIKPERTCRNASDNDTGFTCSECGASVTGGKYSHSYVDKAGVRWYTTADAPRWNRCPNCGAKVVSHGMD